MKKIYEIFTSLSIVLLSVSSCTKDLKLKPVSIISNASFWQTESDAKGGLFGMYTSLRDQNLNLFYLGEARSEVLGPSFSTGPNKYWENSLDANDPGPDWLGFYNIVHNANLILKYVPKINFTSEAEKNNILAQAHTMRAFVYFIMAKSWGDLPLVTQPTEGYVADSTQKERSPKEDIFKFIKRDLDEGIQLFPDNKFPTGRNVWSLPAANALKADVYLWTGKRLNGGEADFNTALTALNAVQTSDIQLLSNFADVFGYNNKGNKEIIMAIRFQQFESGSNWGSSSYMHPSYISPYFDAATLASIGIMAGSPSYTVSDLVRQQFTDDDQRKNATFYEMYIKDPNTGLKTFYGSFETKYKGAVIDGIRLFMDDIVIYRYADILLMKAEVENALGQDPSNEINQVRERAYGNNFSNHVFVNGTKEQNDEGILKERLLELAIEGKRWWDLIRFGKVFEKVPSLQSRAGKDYLLLFPIPETTLSLNPKIKQNPGY